MKKPYLFHPKKRILLITGHYGSGKTEFAVNLARMLHHTMECPFPRVAIVDIDVVNPYFRSRELNDLLAQEGIPVYGNACEGDVTAEIPALSAAVRTPLEDPGCCTILDVGGNDAGARILKQFRKYFVTDECLLLAVINRNRPETRTEDGAVSHLHAIENELGLKVQGLINNTHLLRETSADDIRKGRALCEAVSKETGTPILCDTYPAPLLDASELDDLPGPLFPVQLCMRPEWLDK